MKHVIRWLLASGMLLASQAAWGQILFVASLDGTQETPPDTSHAEGTAWAILSEDLTTLTYSLTYARLSDTLTGAHFHAGAPGVAGSIVHPITITGNTATGVWTGVPDSVARLLVAGGVYVNVHSKKLPGGEIRGQLMLAGGAGFAATLTGDQETPPTGSSAMGTVWAVLDSAGARLSYRATVAGLDTNITGAHFHDAPPDSAGPIVHPISFTDSLSDGAWSGVPENEVIDLLKGRVYLNVHTPVHPGGEIRGQLVKVGPSVFTASLDGGQETPPDSSAGTGTAWVEVSPDLSTLTYSVTYADLSAPFVAAHFHVGPAGVAGPVAIPIPLTGNTIQASLANPADSIIARLVQGNVYVNVHTTAHPGGEIRGQMSPAAGIPFLTTLTGMQETPATGSSAEGTAWALLDSSGARVKYDVTVAGLDTNITGGHFHDGAPGVSGPIVHPITFIDSSASGVWSDVPADDMLELLKGNLYLNVHTPRHPGGEIRGQLGAIPSLVTSVAATSPRVPAAFSLAQNYPNPFNPSTRIGFALAVPGFVSLKVYNVLGQEVATLVNGELAAGSYTATFNGAGLASGVYLYRLETRGANGISRALKMLLLK